MKDFKECPACAEWIREKAIICRFCGAVLTSEALPPFAAREFHQEEHDLTASVQERFGELGLELSHSQKRRIVEFLKSSQDQYRTGSVLFTDITSYTTLCQELKAEYVHEIVRAYYAIFSSTVELYNGFVVEFAGDGALAVFGAPMAFERDVEAAVLAAIDVRERVRKLPEFHGKKIRMSAGIATGEILSAVVREKFPPHYKVIGEAVNLAARVQSSAEPDTVIIDDETHALVKDVFDVENLGPKTFKNVKHEVTTFRVNGRLASSGQRRASRIPLIGRAEQEAALNAFWGQSLGADSRPAIVVTGEAGIGKTRLISEVRGRIGDDALVINAECSPFEEKLPHGLWRNAIAALMESSASADAGTISERLSDWLESLEIPRGEQDALKLIFGVKEALDGPLSLVPTRTVFRLICADLKKVLENSARKAEKRLLFVLDDLQWADKSSLEILGILVTSARPAGVVFVLSHRASFSLPTDQLKAVETIRLEPLTEEDRRVMFNLLGNARDLLPELRDRILQQAEGNPLYLIEFFSSLSRSAADTTTGKENWIPPSLRQMIQARIDSLEEGRKNVLQAGAVLGRRFALQLIQLFDHIKDDLLSRLYALKSAEYLQDDASSGSLHFYFQQNLTREVAYSSLVDRRRRDFHRVVAEHLEDGFGLGEEELLPLLAYHYEHAESHAKASHFLELAGDRCRKMAAVAEARGAYESALVSLTNVKQTDESRRRQFRVLRSLGILDRYAGDLTRARDRNENALRVAQELKERTLALDIRHLLALLDVQSGKTREAQAELRKILADAQKLRDRKLPPIVLNVLGMSHWNRGEFQEAKTFYERCLKSMKRSGNEHLRADIMTNLALIAHKHGKMGVAGGLLSRAIAMRKKSGNRFGLVPALISAGMVKEQEGKSASARKFYEEALQISRTIMYTQGETAVLANLANMALAEDNFKEALRVSAESVCLAQQCSDQRSEAIGRENLALAHMGLRNFEEAKLEREKSGLLAEKLGDCERELSLRLVDAEWDLRHGDKGKGDDFFRQVVADIEERNLKSELPRAQRLWGGSLAARGEAEECRRHMTVALKEARKQSNVVEEKKLMGLLGMQARRKKKRSVHSE